MPKHKIRNEYVTNSYKLCFTYVLQDKILLFLLCHKLFSCFSVIRFIYCDFFMCGNSTLHKSTTVFAKKLHIPLLSHIKVIKMKRYA